MKLILILIVGGVFSLSSCKKDNTDKCWKCTVYKGYIGSEVLFTEQSCTENLYNKQYADANGNALQSYCEEL